MLADGGIGRWVIAKRGRVIPRSKGEGMRDLDFEKEKKKRIAKERQEGCIVDFPARCGMFSFPSTYCFTFY